MGAGNTRKTIGRHLQQGTLCADGSGQGGVREGLQVGEPAALLLGASRSAPLWGPPTGASPLPTILRFSIDST